MVNLVITLRHALKYRGGRVVQRVARRVARNQRGIVDGEKSRCEDVEREETERERERIEMGKDEKAWRKSAIGFDGRITKNHARVGPRGEKLKPRLEKQ